MLIYKSRVWKPPTDAQPSGERAVSSTGGDVRKWCAITAEQAAEFHETLTSKDMAALRSGEVGDKRLALARRFWPMRGGKDDLAAVLEAAKTTLLDGLRRANIFRDLSETELSSLRMAMSEASYHQGDVIFNQGDESSQLYVIASGDVAIFRDEQGKRGQLMTKIVAQLSKGDCFGETELATGDRHSATATATSDHLLCLYVTKAGIEDALGYPISKLLSAVS